MSEHQLDMFSIAASGAAPAPLTAEEIDFDDEPTVVPVPLEPDGPQEPAVPSAGAGQDEQCLGGVLEGQLQGGNQQECAPQGANGSRRGAGEPEQIKLLDIPEWWEEAWKGMPSFKQENCMPWKSIYVHFENRADMDAFSRLIGQKIGVNTRFVWFPEAEIDAVAHMAWVDAEPTPALAEENEMLDMVDEG
jgi:hypothetical protein